MLRSRYLHRFEASRYLCSCCFESVPIQLNRPSVADSAESASFQPEPILLGLPGSQPALIPSASFERLTLYHSRVIKQVDIFRAVLRPRLDSRRIESHRQSHPLFFTEFFARCAQVLPPLSRLAPSIFIAHNAQSTSRFQIAGPTQNAEAPAVGCGGRFGRKLSGESCLLLAWLR